MIEILHVVHSYSDDAGSEISQAYCAWGPFGPKRNFVSQRACSGSECENKKVIRSYRDEAVVLRTQKLGEADRIIWLLTSEHGQIRAVAKGVRRTTSKFGARLEPFSVVDIQLHRGRSLDTIIQVETIASHGELLASDYELYSRDGRHRVTTAQCAAAKDRTWVFPLLRVEPCAITVVRPVPRFLLPIRWN